MEKIKSIPKRESLIVSQGTKYRISNKGIKKVVFVKVQIGTYFGEDYIVRIEDYYNWA